MGHSLKKRQVFQVGRLWSSCYLFVFWVVSHKRYQSTTLDKICLAQNCTDHLTKHQNLTAQLGTWRLNLYWHLLQEEHNSHKYTSINLVINDQWAHATLERIKLSLLVKHLHPAFWLNRWHKVKKLTSSGEYHSKTAKKLTSSVEYYSKTVKKSICCGKYQSETQCSFKRNG